MQLFETTKQKFLHCPGTKEQRDKLKFMPRVGTEQDRTSQNPGRDTGRDGREILTAYQERAEKGFLKQEKDILKQERMF